MFCYATPRAATGGVVGTRKYVQYELVLRHRHWPPWTPLATNGLFSGLLGR